MIHDAKVEVTCDACGVEAIDIEPNYVYLGMSGAGGHYDCSDVAIEKKLKDANWKVIDGKHICADCAEEDSHV